MASLVTTTVTGTLTTSSNLTVNGSHLYFYRAVNSGNPEIHLGSSATNQLHIQSVYAGSPNAQKLNYVAFTTFSSLTSANAGEYRFYVDQGTEKLTINDTGIQVGGSATFSDALTVTKSSGLAPLTLVSNPANQVADIGGEITFTATYRATSDITPVARIRGSRENATANNWAGKLTFHTSPGSDSPSASTEQMRITSTGKVGIGTNDPGQLLEVGNDGNSDYALIGPTKIGGGMGHGDYAGFSHRSMGGTLNYCLLQYSDGNTYLNAASGKTVHLRVNNSNVLKVTGSLATFDVGALFNGYIELDAGLKDKDGSFGTDGYVLTTDGSGDVTWEASPGAGSVDGSGTASYLPLWSDSNTLTNSIISQSGTAYAQVNGGVRITGNHTDSGSQLNIWCDASGNGGAAVHRWYFYTGGNNARSNLALFLGPTGCVGIGTDAPDSLLMVYKSGADSIIHVRGAAGGGDARVRINGYESSELYIDRNNVGRFAFRRTTGTDDLSLLKLNDNYTDNSTIMFWDYSNGNVGIGNAAPSAKLEIKGTGATTGLTFKTTDSVGNASFWIKDGGRVGVHYFPFVVNQDSTDTACPASTLMYIHSGGPFTIKTDGKVGIGTTAPAALLHVSAGYVNTRKSLILTNSSNTPFSGTTYDSVVINQDDVPCIRMRETGNSANVELTFAVGNEYSNSATIGTTGMFKFATNRTVGQTGYLDQNTRMVILADGKVGIGTTDPKARFHVHEATDANLQISCGVASEARLLSVNDADSAYKAMKFYGSRFEFLTGNVGIGTAAPSSTLHVEGAGINVTSLSKANTANLGLRLGYTGVTNSNGYICGGISMGNSGEEYAGIFAVDEGSSAATGLGLFVGTTAGIISDALRIKSDGKVGIGNIAPSAKLFITGDSTSRAFHVVSSSAGNATGYFYTNMVHTGVDTSATVSIRSDHASSSGQVLHVRGDGSGNLLTLNQGGTDRLVVQADGNVGIGTAAPDQIFQVRVAANKNLRVRADSTAVQINARNDANAADVPFYLRGSLFNFQVGSVGIGTTTPYRNAHIYVAPNSDNFEGALQVGGTTAALGGYFGYNSTSSGRLSIISLNNAGGSNAKIYFGFGLDGDGSPTTEVLTLDQNKLATFGGGLLIPNGGAILSKNTSGTAVQMLIVNSSNELMFGSAAVGLAGQPNTFFI